MDEREVRRMRNIEYGLRETLEPYIWMKMQIINANPQKYMIYKMGSDNSVEISYTADVQSQLDEIDRMMAEAQYLYVRAIERFGASPCGVGTERLRRV